jgi:hypothetical protein
VLTEKLLPPLHLEVAGLFASPSARPEDFPE